MDRRFRVPTRSPRKEAVEAEGKAVVDQERLKAPEVKACAGKCGIRALVPEGISVAFRTTRRRSPRRARRLPEESLEPQVLGSP